MAQPSVESRGTTPQWQVWAALLTVYIVWGSTYLAIRVMVETMPPFLAAGIRFVTAGLILMGILALRSGASRLRVTRRELGSSIVVGALLLLIGNGFVTVGEQSVPSGLAALVVGVVPLMVLAIRRIAGERIPSSALVGVLLGFVGLGILMVPGGATGAVSATGALALLVASLSWSIGSFLSRRLSLPADPLVSTAYQLFTAGLLLLAVAGAIGEWNFDSSHFSTGSLLSLAYLVVAGSLVAYTAYTWLLQHAPISRVATYAYVNPVVAVALGFLILSEPITLTEAVGAVLIVVSVAFAIWAENRTASGERRLRASAAHVADEVQGDGTAEVGSPG